MNHLINKTPKYIKNTCHNCHKLNINCINLSNSSYHISLQCNHHICLDCYKSIYINKKNNLCYICCNKENQLIVIYLNIAITILLIQYPVYIWYVLYVFLIWMIKYWLELFYY